VGEAITVRIIPGCPAIVVAETEEERKLAEAALADVECGCQVMTEAQHTEYEAGPAAEVAEEAAEVAGVAEVAEEAREAPVCSLEPDKPWEESVCGVVAAEAGEIAAGKVMARLREEGLVA